MELTRLLEVCRLCLKQSSTNLNIFCDSNVENKIVKVFKFTLKDNEQLSKLVCLSCYECIFRFYDYTESVQQNQTYLDSLLNRNSTQEAQKPTIIIPVTELIQDNIHTEGASSIQIDFKIQNDAPTAVEPTPEDEVDEPGGPEPEKPKPFRRNKGDDLINEYVPLFCEICCEPDSKTFECFRFLQEHYRNSHQVTGYAVCCGRKFTRKDRLVTHITNHINPEAFKCSVCDHASKSRSLLRIHMKQHLGSEERKFACGKCEQKFVLRSQLVNHEATHLEQRDKKHVCDVCGKAFALKFVLTKHKLLHSMPDKEFFCEICAKPLASKANLKAHMESHKGAALPKQKCDVCSQWYKNAETLRTHVRVRHQDQRIHRCDSCDKIFPTKSSLSAHVKYVHLRESNFSCDQCEKRFRKKVELKEHMARVHSGKSLYNCEFCAKSFSCSSNYFTHRKNKHPKEYAKQQRDKLTVQL